ncbi:MAG: hydroxysqualene dehydroxylase HpnE [Planctomycetaceae bacterium]|nr:hydroxysqualene dehydroxylase HpnE [Planctomycetaceae bacterium]
MEGRVIIVGGGLAGLSAAAMLTQHGLTVTLLESRPRLGGRAGSFLDTTTNEWIDTCQHVGMGCCTNLLHFLKLVGVDDLFREERELTFIGPGGERCRFGDHIGPAPLHLAGAFRRLSYLSIGEKWRLGQDLSRLAHPHWADVHDLSFDDWLSRHAQSSDCRDRFWDVILVSALSERAARISVPAARNVFVDGFMSNRVGWRVYLPTAPLDEIYGQRLTAWLMSHGADVRTQAGVQRLEEQNGEVVAARLRSGEVIAADEFVLAVPWHRVRDLVPSSLVDHPVVTAADQIEAAPISSVHLWFGRPVLDVPHAVLVGRLGQWVFTRAQSLNPQPSTLSSNLHYLQVVISASHELAAKPQAEVVAAVVTELGEIWPEANGASLVHGRVVTEHRAVFSPQPGVEKLRPAQQSPMANLQLAGDWTQTGWPATMEGAVRSGYLAAENILRRMGRDASLVQAELPTSWLAQRLFGLRDKRP